MVEMKPPSGDITVQAFRVRARLKRATMISSAHEEVLAVPIDLVSGAVLLGVWAIALIWSIVRTLRAARQGSDHQKGVATGLAIGCLTTAGILLFFKNALPFDTMGVGFVVALVGTAWLWAVAR
jgi:hypothetical protein